jgi:enterochelin esterase-like enzyme
MNYINPPDTTPEHVTHKTFYSHILKHAIGYNIYLPPDYHTSDQSYPVVYHIHGWTGHESSDIWTMEKVYKSRQAITVFMNAVSLETDYDLALLQIESILLDELIPHVDRNYRTYASREHRRLSGFSMGGNMAFYFAIKHHHLFGAVTSYAGTYHHLYRKNYRTVNVSLDKIHDLYDAMIQEQWYLEDNNILSLVRRNADQIRGNIDITLHIGTTDILYCDNEIMHLYLNEMNITHHYKTFSNVSHNLAEIL